jgi:hypothetical protein
MYRLVTPYYGGVSPRGEVILLTCHSRYCVTVQLLYGKAVEVFCPWILVHFRCTSFLALPIHRLTRFRDTTRLTLQTAGSVLDR